MSRLLWIIVIAIWIVILTWFWYMFICKSSGAGSACDKISFSDGTSLDYDGEGNVRFLRGSSNLLLSDSYYDNALATINNYLIKNTGRAVKITGHYQTSESYNNTNFNNLGEARADQIRQLFLSNGIPANQISIAGSTYNIDCASGDTLRQAASFAFMPSN